MTKRGRAALSIIPPSPRQNIRAARLPAYFVCFSRGTTIYSRHSTRFLRKHHIYRQTIYGGEGKIKKCWSVLPSPRIYFRAKNKGPAASSYMQRVPFSELLADFPPWSFGKSRRHSVRAPPHLQVVITNCLPIGYSKKLSDSEPLLTLFNFFMTSCQLNQRFCGYFSFSLPNIFSLFSLTTLFSLILIYAQCIYAFCMILRKICVLIFLTYLCDIRFLLYLWFYFSCCLRYKFRKFRYLHLSKASFLCTAL